jgi:hypothetical protein
MNHSYRVVEGDPAHPLSSTTDAPSDAKPEREEHLGQRAAGRAEHDAEAKLHGTHTSQSVSLGFPVLANLGKKARARLTVFVEGLVGTITIHADRRGADERLRLARPRAHRVDE